MLALLACGLLCLGTQARAAIDNLITSPNVGDMPGLALPEFMKTECDWRGSLVRSVVNNSKGAVSVTPEANKRDVGRVLELQIAMLVAPLKGDNSKRRLGVRARLFFDGRWVAVKDFEDRSMVTSVHTVCESIANLGNNLGGDIAEWLQESDAIVCDSACTGLRPDDPIAIGKEILLASPDAIDEQVRTCNWPSKMVKDFVEDANDMSPPLRAKLFVTNEDILKYTGRKLILKVIKIHLVSGEEKWMEMSGEIIEGGVRSASFHGYQKVRFGSFNPCKTLNTLSENMYNEIENWLVAPTMKAELL
jgi:hypothetical protein